MPQQTESLRILTARPQITLDEWYKLIELRKEAIGRHLDKIRLQQLWEVRCRYSESHFSELGYVSRTCSGAGLNNNTQGIFGHSYKSRKKTSEPYSGSWPDFINIPASGSLSIWGLTRKKRWMIAIVTYRGDEGYKGRGAEIPIRLRIEEVPLPVMLKLSRCSPQQVWQDLAKPFRDYVQGKHQQYEYLREELTRLDIEELLVARQ